MSSYIEYNSEDFKNAEEAGNVCEQSSVLDGWLFQLSVLNQQRKASAPECYNTTFSAPKTYKLVTSWLYVNIFGENEELMIAIVRYLHTLNVKVIKIIVQQQKNYKNYPKPCEEHLVDSYDIVFRLMITYGFNDSTRESFSPTCQSGKKGIFQHRFNNELLIFHNLLNKQNGSLNIQCQFDIVYCGDSLEFGVFTSPKSLIDFVNLINTSINRYNRVVKPYNTLARAHTNLMRTTLFCVRTHPHRNLMRATLFAIRSRCPT